jgi:hypothetical protein
MSRVPTGAFVIGPPTTIGQQVFILAAVQPASSANITPSGQVQFYLDGTWQPPVTLNGNGQAGLYINTLAAGTHVTAVSYGGDVHFMPSATPSLVSFNVNPIQTTTTLVSSAPIAAGVGQPVTWTATVAVVPGRGIPPGSVTFTIDGVNQTPVAVNAAGQAGFCESFTTQGTHSVTATYHSTSTNFAGSGPATLSQSILPATTTTLTPLTTNPAIGQAVTLTATVAPASGTPTDTVTFVIDGVNHTPVAVNSFGQASLSVSFATAGPHVVVADYNGDSNFAPSTAPALHVTMNNVNSVAGLYDLGAAPTVYGQQAKSS